MGDFLAKVFIVCTSVGAVSYWVYILASGGLTGK